MHGMQGKEGGDEGAAFPHAGQPPQDGVEQTGAGQMKRDILQMKPAGVHAEQVAIEHLRPPRQRMPKIIVAGLERPQKARPRETAQDHRVFADVEIIVVVRKIKIINLPIDGQGGGGQEDTDEEVAGGRGESGQAIGFHVAGECSRGGQSAPSSFGEDTTF